MTYDALKTQADMRLVTSDAKLKGRKELYIEDGIVKIPARFKDVPRGIAMTIQDRLHYIGSSRKDSILDVGLHLDEAEVPYAYTSFSRCNRGYQLDALNKATGLDLSPDEALSMTRAFAFDGSPANSMSKLFHLSHEAIKQRFPECRAVVTALNPYLRFGGGILLVQVIHLTHSLLWNIGMIMRASTPQEVMGCIRSNWRLRQLSG